ncbi:RHTO0S22e00562g2_1 [Rhodotorula toruloides]|uniref:RHTO0S22e00562g2_1 n=1 Tax=Rhodotorula toruloides TaxID=5286 RepID=A0A061BG94_RHOTO|nr:RHTO0S22e00562g2_1 [Rhodotorula toruloides]
MPSSISDSELKDSPHPTFTTSSPPATNGVHPGDGDSSSTAGSDEAILARLGYKQEFRREFTNLSRLADHLVRNEYHGCRLLGSHHLQHPLHPRRARECRLVLVHRRLLQLLPGNLDR